MGLFSRRKRTPGVTAEPSARQVQQATARHFQEFVRTRTGVEGYVEPVTVSTPMTLMLIATSGEWTRRRVPDGGVARDLAHELGIPVYDVHRTGYPQRMRDWNSRQRILDKRAQATSLRSGGPDQDDAGSS
jgi:hypothetical protein